MGYMSRPRSDHFRRYLGRFWTGPKHFWKDLVRFWTRSEQFWQRPWSIWNRAWTYLKRPRSLLNCAQTCLKGPRSLLNSAQTFSKRLRSLFELGPNIFERTQLEDPFSFRFCLVSRSRGAHPNFSDSASLGFELAPNFPELVRIRHRSILSHWEVAPVPPTHFNLKKETLRE